MRNFQGKKGSGSLIYSRPFLIFTLILLLFFAWGVMRLFAKLQETAKNKEMAEAKVAELQKTKASLSADISTLETEEGLEESIREKFGLAKEGEGLIVVVDEKTVISEEESNHKNWFARFLDDWFR